MWKTFWNGIHPFIKFLAGLGIATMILFPLFFWLIDAASVFAMVAIFVFLGISALILFDHYALKDLDTVTEIKNGNIAYGFLLLGVAIIIAASILAGSGSVSFPSSGMSTPIVIQQSGDVQ